MSWVGSNSNLSPNANVHKHRVYGGSYKAALCMVKIHFQKQMVQTVDKSYARTLQTNLTNPAVRSQSRYSVHGNVSTCTVHKAENLCQHRGHCVDTAFTKQVQASCMGRPMPRPMRVNHGLNKMLKDGFVVLKLPILRQKTT